jgi:ubiquinone/menaquinone biosynthesis C-methylase UbiE
MEVLMTRSKEKIRTDVQGYYAERALSTSCCGESSDCCPSLYDFELTNKLPDDVANFSLGCGDPITLADLQPGETVLDLGSGGGLDCFLAAKKVGEKGKVIGVDMTPEMLARAWRAASRLGVTNVEFRQGYLEDVPVEDGGIDAVISNCVINLSPDKPRVFSEIYRVLKPGGRLSVSDIVSQGNLPASIKEDAQAWSSCAAGALPVDKLRDIIQQVGFVDITIAAQDKQWLSTDEIPENTLFSALVSARKSG